MAMIDPKTRKPKQNKTKELCYYGCGRTGKYYFHRRDRWCCSQHESSCPVKRKQRSETAKKLWKTDDYRKVHHYNRNKNGWFYKSDDEIFCLNGKCRLAIVRRYAELRKIIPYQCRCGIINEWQGEQITLELHHKNGNKKDNRKENLEFLCPNCHTQTDNYGFKAAKFRLEFAKREFDIK
jgi:5-methylcytosine-specific restriction endonuclease McrA